MKKVIATTLILSMCGLQLTGCAQMSSTEKGAGIGAVAGAVLGAAGEEDAVLPGQE